MSTQLHARIRAIREKTPDSPGKTAKHLNISRQAYMKWESGDTENMKLSNILSFCKRYNVSLEQLLRETQYDITQAPADLRTEQPQASYTTGLDEAEEKLVKFYRNASDDVKKMLLRLVGDESKQPQPSATGHKRFPITGRADDELSKEHPNGQKGPLLNP